MENNSQTFPEETPSNSTNKKLYSDLKFDTNATGDQDIDEILDLMSDSIKTQNSQLDKGLFSYEKRIEEWIEAYSDDLKKTVNNELQAIYSKKNFN